MRTHYLEVADQTIELKTDTLVDPCRYFAEVSICCAVSPQLVPLQIELKCSNEKLTLVDGRRLVLHEPQIGDHLLRQVLLFWAGYHSARYKAIHGAGIIFSHNEHLNKAGILIVGNRGTGKSTIAKLLAEIGNVSYLDDDLLLMEENVMMIGGKMGSVTMETQGRKELQYLPNGIARSAIDLILLLDKRLSGGEYKWMETSKSNLVAGNYFVMDSLPGTLQKKFLERFSSIPVWSPVCLVGTSGKESRMKETLLSIIENSNQYGHSYE